MSPEVNTPGKRVAIVQSNYIPWKGYFDLIHQVDEFVLLDEVQYTRRDWRNRNRIRTERGLEWLTIPLQVSGNYRARIDEMRVVSPTWAEEHLERLRRGYRRAACYDDALAVLTPLYERAARLDLLTEVNELFLRAMCVELGIATAIRRSTEFAAVAGKNERLIAICEGAGAARYLSGPAARGYLDEALFARAGVAVEWMTYDGYAPYPQLEEPFETHVSIVDVLFHTGRAAREYALRPRGAS